MSNDQGDQAGPGKADSPNNLKDLRASANAAAQLCRTVYLTVLVVGAYLAISIGSTTDLMLLKGAGITLPLLAVDLPIRGFYLVAPALFFLLHLNLLLQLRILAGKLWDLDRCIRAQGWMPAEERLERKKLFAFAFSHYLIGDPEDGATRRLLATMVSMSIVVLPLALLLWALIRFLPYHSDVVTWSNRIVVILDIGAILVLWPRIMRLPSVGRRLRRMFRRMVEPTTASRRRLRHLQLSGLMNKHALRYRRRGRLAIWGPVLVAIPILNAAAFPDDAVDRANRGLGALLSRVWDVDVAVIVDDTERLCGARRTCDRLTYWLFDAGFAPFNRNLRLSEAIIVAGSPQPEVVEAATSGSATRWREAQTRLAKLDLRGRDLRFADLTSAKLPKIDLRGARLQNTKLSSAGLPGADLFGARVERARLDSARLQGANLNSAELRGADLGLAQLQDADLTDAGLFAADLRGAGLQGANLRGADLRGANVRGARLSGADLREAQLQGAHMGGAALQGTDLRDARLQGADLRNAQLQGATLRAAQLQGADLGVAQLQGADLRDARLQGANLNGAELDGADLRGAQLQGASLNVATTLRFADVRWIGPDPLSQDQAKRITLIFDQAIGSMSKVRLPADLRKVVKERLESGSERVRVLKSDPGKRKAVLSPAVGRGAWCKLPSSGTRTKYGPQPNPAHPPKECQDYLSAGDYYQALMDRVIHRVACNTDEAAVIDSFARRALASRSESGDGFAADYRGPLARTLLGKSKSCPARTHLPEATIRQLETVAAQADR